MRTLILTVAILALVPTLRAQQAETKENPPQAAPQENTEHSNTQNSLHEAIRPGHPLDPAHVDILTGKRVARSKRRAEEFRLSEGAMALTQVHMQ